jgi:hypothetical protein
MGKTKQNKTKQRSSSLVTETRLDRMKIILVDHSRIIMANDIKILFIDTESRCATFD